MFISLFFGRMSPIQSFIISKKKIIIITLFLLFCQFFCFIERLRCQLNAKLNFTREWSTSLCCGTLQASENFHYHVFLSISRVHSVLYKLFLFFSTSQIYIRLFSPFICTIDM